MSTQQNHLVFKYRPRKLDDVVDQNDVITAIKNASKSKDFYPYILLEGPTGTGKTTIANIISAIIHCQNPITCNDGHIEPCGECNFCKDIFNESYSLNTFKKNGPDMGKSGVEQLIDNSQMMPIIGNSRRVYIIDEAQALSKQAKASTLSLFEILPHKTTAMYILCTMDSSSFDKAILDRLQRYKFGKIPTEDIINHLQMIASNELDENIYPLALETKDDEDKVRELANGIAVIATQADGSIRNAIQLFQSCIDKDLYTEEEITKYIAIEIHDIETKVNLLYSLLDKEGKKFFKYFQTHKELSYHDFFRYTFAIMIGAEIYRTTGFSRNFYEENNYKAILKKNTFPLLLKTYKTINNLFVHATNGYQSNNNSIFFHDHTFKSYISDYFTKVIEVPKIHKTVSKGRVPVK